MTQKHYAIETKLIKAFFCLSFSLFSFILHSQTGPGGVGTTDGTSELTFWLNTSKGITTTRFGTTSYTYKVDLVEDQSGYGNDLFDPSSSGGTDYRPDFVDGELNGWPVIRFTGSANGSTEYLEGPGTQIILGGDGDTEHTQFNVYRNLRTSELDPGAGYITSLKYSTSGNGYSLLSVSLNLEAETTTSGTFSNDTAVYTYGVTGFTVYEEDGIGSGNYKTVNYDDDEIAVRTDGHDLDPTLSSLVAVPNSSTIMYVNGTEKVNTSIFTGIRPFIFSSADPFTVGARTATSRAVEADLAETIIFSRSLNEAERILVENYLSAKYNTTLDASVDHYDNSYESTGTGHFYDVAGIGQSNGETHLDGSSDVLNVTSSLDTDGEFFLMGHDNEGATNWVTYSSEEIKEIPNGNVAVLEREWRVDHTLASSGKEITLTWDHSSLSKPTLYDSLYILIDTDGDFSGVEDQTSIKLTETQISLIDSATFSIDSIAKGDYIKLARAVPPSAPTGLKASNYQYLSSMVEWEAVTADKRGNPLNEVGISYQVYYHTDGIFDDATYFGTTTDTELEVTGLANDDTYYFWVVTKLDHPSITSEESEYTTAETGVKLRWESAEFIQFEQSPVESFKLILTDTIPGSDIYFDVEVGGEGELNSMFFITDSDDPGYNGGPLADAGQNYSVGDLFIGSGLLVTDTAVIRVNRVGSGGEITDFSMINGGTGYTNSGPLANTFSYSYTGSAGTDASFRTAIQADTDDFFWDVKPEDYRIPDTDVERVFDSEDLQLAIDSYTEPDESFSIKITSVIDNNSIYTPEILPDDSIMIYTIQDDDNPRKIFFSDSASTISEPTSGTSELEITVSTTLEDDNNDTRADYIILSTSTAGDASDYVLSEGTITIPSGTTVVPQTITVTINSDAIYDPDETIELRLINPVNCNLVDSGAYYNKHIVTIEDDVLPKISFVTTSASEGEDHYADNGGVGVGFGIESDLQTAEDITISYELGGTASVESSDYTLSSSSIVWPAGEPAESTVMIDEFITILDDVVYEGDESLTLELLAGDDNEVGTDNVYTLTIEEDEDAPVVTFDVSSQPIIEYDTTISVTFNIDQISELTTEISYNTSTSSAKSSDFTDDEGGTVSIVAGQTSVQADFTIIDDSIVESPETVVVTIDDVTNGTNSGDTHTINIYDDEVGPDGPGGVGDSDKLVLWLRADMGVYSDITATTESVDAGSALFWEDQSGRGNDFEKVSGTPTYNESDSKLNEQPSISFNGSSVMSGPTSKALIGDADFLTSYIVYRSNSSDWDYLLSIKNDAGKSAFAFGINKTESPGEVKADYAGFLTDEWTTWLVDTANYSQDVATMLGGIVVGELSRSLFINGETKTGYGNNFHGMKSNSNNLNSVYLGGLDNTNNIFTGAIAEVIVYTTVLDDLQRSIVENYLAEKYGISVPSARQFYSNANYNSNVVGIGKTNVDEHNAAKGIGMVKIENPSDLDQDEYFFIGRDTTSLTSNTREDLPELPSSEVLDNLWGPKWHAQYEDKGSSNDEIGTIDISIDYPGYVSDTSAVRLIIFDGDDFSSSGDVLYDKEVTSFKNGVFSFDEVTIVGGNFFTLGSTSADFVLPVELLHFSLENGEDGVEVSWTTASEENNDYFILERSLDGIEWSKISVAKGAGNTNNPTHYKYVDKEPFIGSNYYRLTQVDYDGTEEWLGIKVIDFNAESGISIFPNPMTNNRFTITSSYEINIDNIQLVSLIGKEIPFSISQNSVNSYEIKVQQYPGSLFILKFNGADWKIINGE